MKPHGRIVCCGVVSQYDTADPAPGPRGIPGLLVNNRVRMEGFLVFDFADRYDEARPRMRAWLDAGEIASPCTTRSPGSSRRRRRSSTSSPAATSARASCASIAR